MKKFFYTPVLVALLTAFVTVSAQDRQDYLGLPGDNLNLFAVMKLFQESETLEGFERNLNDQNNYINNLDLNGDGYVDYLRVIDNVDRNVHFIVLQVAINPRENQDVAVFTVVRESDGRVTIQLVGDEALYGRNYIVEPIYDETPNPGYTGRKVNGQRVTVVHTNYHEVAAWPVIRFIFMPTYVVWHSPWYWDYYPVYWRPWSPFYWHHYYGYHYNYYSWYYGHYRHWNNHRYDYWHNTYYARHHHHSPYVSSRINEGYYKRTYSKPETRKEGLAMYQQRTRSAGGGPANVSNSSARRSAGGSTVNSNTSRSRETSTSGTRTSGTRQASGTGTVTNGSRQSSTGNRTSSGTDVRRSTSTGTRESSVRTESGTNNNSESTTRRSSTTTKSTSTYSKPEGTTRQSGSYSAPASRSSERRTSVESTSRSSSSGQSVSKSSGQRSGSSVSSSDRRSGSSGNSGTSTKSTSNSKSTENTRRR